MGTINHKTSDYITMANYPLCACDLEKDPDFMDCIREGVKEYGGTIEEAIETYIRDVEEEDFFNVENILEKYDFYYFHVVIEPGYYEGFSIQIENNFQVYFDCWEDKRDAQKEITRIKAFLLECADCGIVQCFPGWCTGYANREETIEGIKEAVKAMREEVKATPTWLQYERADCV